MEVRRRNGIAGQFALDANVPGYGAVSFVGSTYGTPGPVVLVTKNWQTFVTDPERFGPRLDRSWVAAFFAPNGGA